MLVVIFLTLVLYLCILIFISRWKCSLAGREGLILNSISLGVCMNSNFVLSNKLAIPGEALISSGSNVEFVAGFAFFVAVIFSSTVMFGKLFKKIFKIPVVAGQILGGIILGPSVINIAKLSFFSVPLEISVPCLTSRSRPECRRRM